MAFSGTLNAPPPCVINNGQRIDVDFGEQLGISQIDGQRYLQNVNYRIDCEPGGSGQTLGLTLVAAASGLTPPLCRPMCRSWPSGCCWRAIRLC